MMSLKFFKCPYYLIWTQIMTFSIVDFEQVHVCCSEDSLLFANWKFLSLFTPAIISSSLKWNENNISLINYSSGKETENTSFGKYSTQNGERRAMCKYEIQIFDFKGIFYFLLTNIVVD